MEKIIAFAGSNSQNSINHALITHVAQQLSGIDVIRLTDFDFPMYGIDLEQQDGIPSSILQLMEQLQQADYAIIACSEHNGLMSAYFKNILDWLSRTGVNYLETTPVLLLSASTGKGGAKRGMAAVEKLLGYAHATVIGHFSLPSFHSNFDLTQHKITNQALEIELQHVLNKL